MVNSNLLFGIFLVLVGLISLVGKIFKIKKMFWKLEAFEKSYGQKWGNRIHTLSYVVIPIIVGVILMWRSM